MTMFCNYGHPLVPGIGTLDNFYAKQHADGEICREIVRATGQDFGPWVNSEHKGLFSRWGDLSGKGFSVKYVGREVPEPPPCLTLDSLNHPLFAWAELESVRVTGDRSRLPTGLRALGPLLPGAAKIPSPGQRPVRDRLGHAWTTRPAITPIAGGGAGVDISAEMVLFANQLAEIADLLGKKDEAAALRSEAAELARVINEKMWDPERKFYFDLTVDGKRSPVKTVAAYWTLLAGVANAEQADALAAELSNPKSFGRKHRVPTCPADQKGFNPKGGYWQGAVWAPINTMVIRGLERYGKRDLARQIAREDLQIVGRGLQEDRHGLGELRPGRRQARRRRPNRTSSAGRGSSRSFTSSSTASDCGPTPPTTGWSGCWRPTSVAAASGSASTATRSPWWQRPAIPQPGPDSTFRRVGRSLPTPRPAWRGTAVRLPRPGGQEQLGHRPVNGVRRRYRPFSRAKLLDKTVIPARMNTAFFSGSVCVFATSNVGIRVGPRRTGG